MKNPPREKKRLYDAATERRRMYKRMVAAVLTEQEREAFGAGRVKILADLVSGVQLGEREEVAAMEYMTEPAFKGAFDRILDLRLQVRLPQVYDGLVKSARKGSGAASRNVQELLRRRPAARGEYLKRPDRPVAALTREDLLDLVREKSRNLGPLDPLAKGVPEGDPVGEEELPV